MQSLRRGTSHTLKAPRIFVCFIFDNTPYVKSFIKAIIFVALTREQDNLLQDLHASGFHRVLAPKLCKWALEEGDSSINSNQSCDF